VQKFYVTFGQIEIYILCAMLFLSLIFNSLVKLVHLCPERFSHNTNEALAGANELATISGHAQLTPLHLEEILKEVEKAEGKVILFIEEIHLLVLVELEDQWMLLIKRMCFSLSIFHFMLLFLRI